MKKRFAVGTVHQLKTSGLMFEVVDHYTGARSRLFRIDFRAARGFAFLSCFPEWAAENFRVLKK